MTIKASTNLFFFPQWFDHRTKHAVDILACLLGYVGLQCEISCVYPLYGLECQSVCNCSRELCLISTGCIKHFTSTGGVKEKRGKRKKERVSVYLHFNLTIFNFIDYYKTSSHTKRLTDSTTLVRNNKLTTYDTFSSMFYQTSERSLFTKSDNLTPISSFHQRLL